MKMICYLEISQLRECIDDDTEDDVETDCCDEDEEGYVENNNDGRTSETSPEMDGLSSPRK